MAIDLIAMALALNKSKKYTNSVALNGVPVNYPNIVDGIWKIFDPVSNAYISTGVEATGDNGITPHIDSVTGNWFIGTVDTGVKAAGSLDVMADVYP